MSKSDAAFLGYCAMVGFALIAFAWFMIAEKRGDQAHELELKRVELRRLELTSGTVAR